MGECADAHACIRCFEQDITSAALRRRTECADTGKHPSVLARTLPWPRLAFESHHASNGPDEKLRLEAGLRI